MEKAAVSQELKSSSSDFLAPKVGASSSVLYCVSWFVVHFKPQPKELNEQENVVETIFVGKAVTKRCQPFLIYNHKTSWKFYLPSPYDLPLPTVRSPYLIAGVFVFVRFLSMCPI